jgi:hypothetical protein
MNQKVVGSIPVGVSLRGRQLPQVITDPETGTVLKECHEPLSEHRGLGGHFY